MKGHELESREMDILHHSEKPKTREEFQMSLAVELFERDMRVSLNLDDHEARNEAMLYWINSKHSAAYGKLVDSEEFKNSGRTFDSITLYELDDIISEKD